jgi:hypothetical protein
MFVLFVYYIFIGINRNVSVIITIFSSTKEIENFIDKKSKELQSQEYLYQVIEQHIISNQK